MNPTRRLFLAAPLLLPRLARGQSPLKLVASFSILADMVREIAGSAAEVAAIVGPGQDAHGFQARPSDLRLVKSANLVFGHGLGFDPWMDRLVRSAGFAGPYVRAAAAIPPRGRDPHAFQDLRTAPAYAKAIADAVVRLRPGTGAEERRDDLLRRAAETDAWVRDQLAAVPPPKRVVLTSHDAFGWFGAAYGVKFLAPQGVSTESEPSAAEVARLVRQIRETGVRAVFIESMASPRLVQQLARDTGVQPGGTLYSDALGPPSSLADTWLGMFRHNVPLMVAAMRQ